MDDLRKPAFEKEEWDMRWRDETEWMLDLIQKAWRHAGRSEVLTWVRGRLVFEVSGTGYTEDEVYFGKDRLEPLGTAMVSGTFDAWVNQLYALERLPDMPPTEEMK